MKDTAPLSPTALVEEEIIAMSVLNFERMPMLDLIFERFELSLAKAFRSFTSAPTDVELSRLSYTTYDHAMLDLGDRCIIGIAEVLPWHGPIAVPMEAGFLYSALEVIMGGKASGGDKLARGFTRIETRIAHRLCDLTLTDLAASFAQVTDVSFEIKRMEATAQLATITQPSSPCVKADFSVSFGGRSGVLSIILPHASLEPIRENLTKVFYGDRLGGNAEWRDHLSDRITRSSLTVTAVLQQVRVPLSEVLDWAPGQTIDLRTTEDQDATLICAGVPIAKGPTGHCANGAVAVRVTEDLGAVSALVPQAPAPKRVSTKGNR